jgi:hypothetical protein
MISQSHKPSWLSRAAGLLAIPVFAVAGAIVLTSCLPAELATTSLPVPTNTLVSTTLPDKFIAGTQTQQVFLLTPSPGPGTLKPPVPAVVPQATVFQPDPLATPLGAGALFIGSGPFSSPAFYLESQWYQDVDAGNRRIFVGVGSMAVLGADKPTDQGIVIVAEAKWINGNVIFLEGAKGQFPTAQATGSLHITDAQGARLVLKSSNGTTYYFDVPSRQFVDSLNAPPPPTVTEPPDPTSIPTYAPPTLGPLPTAYPIPETPTSIPTPTRDAIASATAEP